MNIKLLIYHEDILRMSKNIPHPRKYVSAAHVSEINRSHHPLAQIVNLRIYECQDQDLIGIASTLQNLERLHIAARPKCRNDHQFEKYNNWKDFTDDGLAHLVQCKKLTHLEICGKQVSGEALAKLIELKYINFLRINKVDNDLISIIVSTFPNLEQLKISGDCTDEGLAHLGQCTNLTHLWLHGNFTDKGLAHLGECTKLSHLEICSDFATGKGLSSLVELSLTSLEVENKNVDIHIIASTFKNLERLVISGDFTDDGVAHLHQCTKLTHLEIINPSFEGSEGLGMLASLPHLTVLKIYHGYVDCNVLVKFPSLRQLWLPWTCVIPRQSRDTQDIRGKEYRKLAEISTLSVFATDFDEFCDLSYQTMNCFRKRGIKVTDYECVDEDGKDNGSFSIPLDGRPCSDDEKDDEKDDESDTD